MFQDECNRGSLSRHCLLESSSERMKFYHRRLLMREKYWFFMELSKKVVPSNEVHVDSKKKSFQKAVRYVKRKIGVESRRRHKGRFVKQINPT
jgi:predicted peptidase